MCKTLRLKLIGIFRKIFAFKCNGRTLGIQMPQGRLKIICIIDGVGQCRIAGAILVINFRRLNIP